MYLPDEMPRVPEARNRPRAPLTKRMRRGHWMAIDCVVAVLVALSGMFGVASGPAEAGRFPAGVVVLAAVILLAVGLRRRGPVPAFAALAVTVLFAARFPGTSRLAATALLAMAYVLYLVTAERPRRTGIAALLIALGEIGAYSVVMGIDPAGDSGGGATFPMAFATIVAWIAGYSVRQRRAYAQVLQEQAASSAVAGERLRIARELHDVVAHSMSVIAVQAGYGQYVIDASPADARQALGVIQSTSREALGELRRMLGVLRQQDAATPAPAPLAPECGLDGLDRLAERTSAAGVRVSLVRLGAVRAVPSGIGLSAYRIIQEALTNVVRHAGGGARCEVTVRYGGQDLAIEVTDDGGLASGGAAGGGTVPVVHEPGSGHGIIGMRERAHLCGGECSAGPLPAGGFRVTARLPLPGPAEPSPAGSVPVALAQDQPLAGPPGSLAWLPAQEETAGRDGARAGKKAMELIR